MAKMKWRLLNTGYSTGDMNMALDEAILKSVKAGDVPPTIRFYGWDPAAVSLGYFQSLEKEIDIEGCKERGVDIVRRLTGGRAVLHDDELTYSLVISEELNFLPDSIIESYKIISQGLLAGLQELGIEAKMVSLADKKKKSGSQSAACFDAPSWYEISVDGKKLVGSAQTRRDGVILQHGSILNTQDVDKLMDTLKFKSDRRKERFKKIFAKKATTIQEAIGQSFTLKELSIAFKKGMEEGMDIILEEGQLTEKELSLAKKLAAEKYSSQDWNFKR
ncbi:lipoate--protein ligase family protein [Selenihalanaerobacter shriftii]|uniref:Lipoate-protein ligase A n=1 Tax=Selenihalanaerobacter shriftii TaxID=142842 RepID=A0A1T4JJY9_9FIRM|nr:lipoate-protein ligase A [Selenihalanaerobacter shriftii]